MSPHEARMVRLGIFAIIIFGAAIAGYTMSKNLYHFQTPSVESAPSIPTTRLSVVSDVIESPTESSSSVVTVPESLVANPPSDVFEEGPRNSNTSNVVGYFANGAFLIEVPEWIVQGWSIDTSTDQNTMTISPRSSIENRDFSDIVVTHEPTSETFNAEYLYDLEPKVGHRPVVNKEIFFNDTLDMRVYLIETQLADTMFATFFVDGKGKTAKVIFSANKTNYYYYVWKVRQFLKSLTLAAEPRG